MGYILRQLSCILFILRHIVTFCASYELYTTNNAAYIYLAFRNYTCWTYTFVFHRTEMLYFHWFKNKTWLPNLVFFVRLVRLLFGNKADVQPTHLDMSFYFKIHKPCTVQGFLFGFVVLWNDITWLCLEQNKTTASIYVQTSAGENVNVWIKQKKHWNWTRMQP